MADDPLLGFFAQNVTVRDTDPVKTSAVDPAQAELKNLCSNIEAIIARDGKDYQGLKPIDKLMKAMEGMKGDMGDAFPEALVRGYLKDALTSCGIPENVKPETPTLPDKAPVPPSRDGKSR